MFTNDYILRQIEMLSGGLERLLGKERKTEHFELKFLSGDTADGFLDYLLGLIAGGEYNRAEDELFDYLAENNNIDSLSIIVGFYKVLLEESDKDLREGNFSRDEISRGVTDAFKIIGAEQGQF